MGRNVEIKARLRDAAACEERARKLADGPGQILHQKDVFYACPRGRLKLRHLDDGTGARDELIAYLRPDGAAFRLSRYVIHPTTEPDSLHAALDAALGASGCVNKERHLYLIGRTRVHIDRVVGLGDYLELEVVLTPEQSVSDGQAIARQIMMQLEVPDEDMVDVAYIDLLNRRD